MRGLRTSEPGTEELGKAHRWGGLAVASPLLDTATGTAAEGGASYADVRLGAAGLRLGDLVAITDIDARFNAGYRRGWVSVGLVVHGGSPRPGHGPGITVILSGPADASVTHVDAADHRGLCEETVLGVAGSDR